MLICALAAGARAAGTSKAAAPARSKLRIATLRAHGAALLTCHIVLSSRVSALELLHLDINLGCGDDWSIQTFVCTRRGFSVEKGMGSVAGRFLAFRSSVVFRALVVNRHGLGTSNDLLSLSVFARHLLRVAHAAASQPRNDPCWRWGGLFYRLFTKACS